MAPSLLRSILLRLEHIEAKVARLPARPIRGADRTGSPLRAALLQIVDALHLAHPIAGRVPARELALAAREVGIAIDDLRRGLLDLEAAGLVTLELTHRPYLADPRCTLRFPGRGVLLFATRKGLPPDWRRGLPPKGSRWWLR